MSKNCPSSGLYFQPLQLNCAGRILDLSRPRVMGILNVTPDSFHDGGRYQRLDAALARARALVAEGAAILDIGGESTRPGAVAVSAEEEMERVIPVIEHIIGEVNVPISIDTDKPAVMQAALRAGAGLINDLRALTEKGALATVAQSNAAVCLAHAPVLPHFSYPNYQDVVSEVLEFLRGRVEACVQAGIVRERLLVDPGFGFGKRPETDKLRLLHGLAALKRLRLPILVGLSRKSCGLGGSIAAAVLAVQQGAAVVRAHDVKETVEALDYVGAVERQGAEKAEF